MWDTVLKGKHQVRTELWAPFAPASPPDVRYRLKKINIRYELNCGRHSLRLRRPMGGRAPPCRRVLMKRFGAVPLVRALPPTAWAKGGTGGTAQILFSTLPPRRSRAPHRAAKPRR